VRIGVAGALPWGCDSAPRAFSLSGSLRRGYKGTPARGKRSARVRARRRVRDHLLLLLKVCPLGESQAASRVEWRMGLRGEPMRSAALPIGSGSPIVL
jgi:hypothetical protein